MTSSPRALGAWLLVAAVFAGCGRGAEGPDTRAVADAVGAARLVEGPVSVVISESPPGRGPRTPASVEFVPPDPTRIERVRDARAVLAAPSMRTRLELLGYVLREVSGAAGWSLVAGRLHCATVRTTSWSPLPGLEYSGRLGLEIPDGAGGEMVLIVGDHGPLRLTAETSTGDEIPLAVEPLQNAPGARAPPADFWLDRGAPDAAPRDVVRVRLPAAVDDTRLVGLRFGRRAPQVLARLAGYDGDARARVCAASLGGEDVVTGEAPVVDVLGERADLYGAGWYGVEPRASERLRWMGREAALLVPSRVSGRVRVETEAMPPEGVEAPVLGLSVNGIALPAHRVTRGVHLYDWDVPAGVWLAGTNEITLRAPIARPPTGDDRRELGMGIRALRVRLYP